MGDTINQCAGLDLDPLQDEDKKKALSIFRNPYLLKKDISPEEFAGLSSAIRDYKMLYNANHQEHDLVTEKMKQEMGSNWQEEETGMRATFNRDARPPGQSR